jgi:uncharacterized protein
MSRPDNSIVHLELHTSNMAGALAFYTEVMGWRAQAVDAGAGVYQAMDPVTGITTGVVECETKRPLWLPYVQVSDIAGMTGRAQEYGATVALEPREGPAGWRSVLAAGCGAEFALWQPKR